MYFFYVDESGSKDPDVTGVKKDGTSFDKDWLYVLFAISIFDGRWDRFERLISDRKMRMIHKVSDSTGERFDLANVEIHSSLIRRESLRLSDPFFKHVHINDVNYLLDAYYTSIQSHHMNCFAIIVDKKELPSYFTQESLHKKTYELLLERIEQFLENYHPKQKGLIIMDNSSKQLNRALAMEHSYFLKNGSSSGVRFKHIVEMPLFVESSLSNGTQLSDLCAYNCYHSNKYNKPDYLYFQKILPSFYNSPKTKPEKWDGIKIYPESSERVKKVINEALEVKKTTIELLPPNSY